MKCLSLLLLLFLYSCCLFLFSNRLGFLTNSTSWCFGFDAGNLRRGLGFLPVEVNASDTRNKSDSNTGAGINGKLANSIKELATNRAIGLGSDGKPKKVRSGLLLPRKP